MKRALIIAAAMSFLLPGLSVAQSDQQGAPNAGAQSRPGGRPATPTNRPATPTNRPGTPTNRPSNNRPGPPARPPGRPNPPPQPNGRQPSRPQPGKPPQSGRPGVRPPLIAQPLPPRGNQFWHRGQYYGRIRGPAFAYPPGWQYRRWTIGGQLPALFLAPGYFYQGWAALGLEAPPPGYAWVRYGPDLLEVNLSTGEVEDVVYGVFM
jgi:Ni/Co efflux regulator RcnB